MYPIHLLALAVGVWAISLFGRAFYTLAGLLAYALCWCYCYWHCVSERVVQWSGNAPDIWGIKLAICTGDTVWILCVVILTALYVWAHPARQHWACGALLATAGICVADDLFHIYVWLEVMTFVTQGFVCTNNNLRLRRYWGVQVVSALLILWGTVFIYRDSGTLTLPIAITRASVGYVMLWILGWVAKLNLVANWMAHGYATLEKSELFYFMSVCGKQAFLPLTKTAPLLPVECYACVTVVAIIAMFCAFWMRRITMLDALVANTIFMNGISVLIVLYVPQQAAIYLAHAMLAEALLISSVLSRSASFLWAWVSLVNLPPSCMFFFKAQLIHTVPQVLWVSAIAAIGSAIILRSQIESQIACAVNKYYENHLQTFLAVGLVVFNIAISYTIYCT